MKVYIAGPLFDKKAEKVLDKIDKICKELGLDSFLPGRDAGKFEKGDSKPFFKSDSKEIDNCQIMIAYLDWKGISSGTAWEIGYAYAKRIPVIGFVEDLGTAGKFDRLCVMCFNSVELVDSLEKLKERLKKAKSGL